MRSSGREELSPALEEALAGFEAHLRDERGRSAHTVRAYLGDVRALLRFAVEQGVVEPAELDLMLLRSWLASMDRAGAARTSLARRVAAARAFTDWACRRGIVPTDPAVRLKILCPNLGITRSPIIHDVTNHVDDAIDPLFIVAGYQSIRALPERTPVSELWTRCLLSSLKPLSMM